MPQLLKGPHDILRWDTIFTLLSMDCTEPFLPEMGLRLIHLDVVRAHARRFVQQYDVNTETTQDQDEALVQALLVAISQEASPEVASHLAQWGRDYFLYGAEEDHTVEPWIKLLCYVAGIYPAPIPPPPFPESKLEKIKQVTHEQLGDSYWRLREVLEEIDQQPKSAWDEAIYQAYRASEPELAELLSPLDWVKSSIHYHRFRLAWVVIKTILTPDELRVLLEWGKVQAHDLRMDSVWELELPE